ncbi:MAG: CoB--CoM heterodisulfide reductase iron-sulfur subunit B family protein, partial [Candidatus Bipolaricaulia bacterium]
SYMTVPCASCFSRFRNALHEVDQDPKLRKRIAEAVDYDFSKGPKVDSLLTTMTDRVGYDRIRQAVTKPLAGLKVVSYYGCLLTRPPEVTGEEHYEYPTNMDRLMEALGAESLDWSYKTECCGSSLSLTQLPIALEMSRKILENAKEVGAEAIVVACPLCHANLDLRQRQIAEGTHEEFDLPILYFTQVMGLAFGLEPRRLGLEKHFVDPLPLLERKGLLA